MKSKTQETKNNFFYYINILLITAFAFTSITAPFWHIYFEKGANDGIFGFSSLRTFLYSFGTHFILFGCSVFLIWFINFSKNPKNRISRIANFIACSFCSVSVYYLLYVFIDTTSPYPDYYYEIAFILTSILTSVFILIIFQYFKKIKQKRMVFENESKKFITTALDFIKEINQAIVS